MTSIETQSVLGALGAPRDSSSNQQVLEPGQRLGSSTDPVQSSIAEFNNQSTLPLDETLKYNKSNELFTGISKNSKKFCRECGLNMRGDIQKLTKHYRWMHSLVEEKPEWLKRNQEPRGCIYSNWTEFMQNPRLV